MSRRLTLRSNRCHQLVAQQHLALTFDLHHRTVIGYVNITRRILDAPRHTGQVGPEPGRLTDFNRAYRPRFRTPKRSEILNMINVVS